MRHKNTTKYFRSIEMYFHGFFQTDVLSGDVLHGEIKFHPGKAGQISTCTVERFFFNLIFLFILFYFRFILLFFYSFIFFFFFFFSFFFFLLFSFSFYFFKFYFISFYFISFHVHFAFLKRNQMK